MAVGQNGHNSATAVAPTPMPRKFLRRWIPAHKKHLDIKSLNFMRPLMSEPNLLHLNRHSVSVAMFVGLFCAFLPIPGQTLVALALALLLRANLPISIALIWITNPLTMPAIYFMTYELGRWLLDSPPVGFDFKLSWEWFSVQGRAIVAPLVVGSVLTGLVTGTLGYFTIHQLWRWHVVRNWEARKRRRKTP